MLVRKAKATKRENFNKANERVCIIKQLESNKILRKTVYKYPLDNITFVKMRRTNFNDFY